jgi:hypothetical protein
VANLLHIPVELFNLSLALQFFVVSKVFRNPLDDGQQFVNAALQGLWATRWLPVYHFIQRTRSL